MAKVMKITGTNPILTVSPQRPTADKSEVEEAKKEAVKNESELQSAGLRESLENSDSVDMSLVKSLKEAIARGEVVLDPGKIADSIIGMHSS